MILDTSAMVAAVSGERSAPAVLHALADAGRLLMSAATATELWIVVDSSGSPQLSGEVDTLLRDLDAQIVPCHGRPCPHRQAGISRLREWSASCRAEPRRLRHLRPGQADRRAGAVCRRRLPAHGPGCRGGRMTDLARRNAAGMRPGFDHTETRGSQWGGPSHPARRCAEPSPVADQDSSWLVEPSLVEPSLVELRWGSAARLLHGQGGAGLGETCGLLAQGRPAAPDVSDRGGVGEGPGHGGRHDRVLPGGRQGHDGAP